MKRAKPNLLIEPLNGKSTKPNTIKVQPHEKDTTKERETLLRRNSSNVFLTS